MRRISIFIVFVLLSYIGIAGAVKPTHLDRDKNPEECSGCHSGVGVPGTPLLKDRPERLCFRCHGTMSRGRAKTDIESVFSKNSIHPVFETSKYHLRGEDLPERVPTTPRHVACPDCHSAHATIPQAPWAGTKGYSQGRLRGKQAQAEYELCYLCHSDSANLPPGQKNKREEFSLFNESYHPIEGPGRNHYVPSLIRGLSENSLIKCTDCHGNNDRNGAKGPHGSDYSPILVATYTTTDGIESPKTYELCYMCHDRRSILGDESFKKHSFHIINQNTSCYTCHSSHGSRDTKNLIVFNPLVVSPSNSGLAPQYIPDPVQTRCYLKCHNSEHNPSGVFRPDGTKSIGSW